jgi:hypothetical protein
MTTGGQRAGKTMCTVTITKLQQMNVHRKIIVNKGVNFYNSLVAPDFFNA